MALSGIILQQAYKHGWWGLQGDFFLNGMQVSFITAIVSSLVYVIVSLVDNKTFDMDKLLHHGKYAVAEDSVEGELLEGGAFIRFFSKFGLTKEFNKRDKFVFFFALGYAYFWFFIFLFGTIYNYVVDVKPAAWMMYWKYYTMFMFVILIAHSTWMIIGGTMDIRKMFHRLRTAKRNEHDDGWVQKKG
jgi:solute:Na+ symporter, SSS family